MQKSLSGNAFVFGNNVDTGQIYLGRFVEFTDVEDVAKTRCLGLSVTLHVKSV